MKGDREAAPKRTEVETETESSEDDTGRSWDTVCDKRSLRQERRARKAGRHIDSQESQAKDDSSADEDNNSTGKASAALSHGADKKESHMSGNFRRWFHLTLKRWETKGEARHHPWQN